MERGFDSTDGGSPLTWKYRGHAISLTALGLAVCAWTLVFGTARAEEPYRDLICSYFGSECDKAMRVMLCESRGDPMAYSAGNIGLFQINVIHRGMVGGDANLFYDPEENVRIAHELWLSQGWQPWSFCGR